MPTRAAILGTLAASQTQVMAFFAGLSPEDLERPATASGVPGEAPWRAKDHLAHLAPSERAIQRLLRRTRAGESRDGLLRLQYPAGMQMPGTPGDLSALTPEEEERLVRLRGSRGHRRSAYPRRSLTPFRTPPRLALHN